MNFFKAIWAALFSPQPAAPRTVNSVADLQLKDMLQMSDSFALPAALRGQQLEVQSINTYDYDGDKELEWVLKGSNDLQIYLSLDEDDTSSLALSLKISRGDVGTLFDADEFAGVFDSNQSVTLTTRGAPEHLAGWYADSYAQSNVVEPGRFHRQDHRQSGALRNGEDFDLYTLMDGDEDKGVDIEVYRSGQTDVCLTIYRPLSDIVDFFPAS